MSSTVPPTVRRTRDVDRGLTGTNRDWTYRRPNGGRHERPHITSGPASRFRLRTRRGATSALSGAAYGDVCWCCMSATRTQVYFTAEQRRRIDAFARREGKTLAQVVREAVDAYVAQAPPELDAVLAESFGSMPDLRVAPRSEWDRGYG